MLPLLNKGWHLVRSLLAQLELLQETASTNAYAMAQTQDKSRTDRLHGYVCLAEYQSAGRGRRGRSWCSPYGSNIYLTAVAEFESGASALEGLSLVVGIALVRALRLCGVESAQLKWPNDVLVQGKKLAGIFD